MLSIIKPHHRGSVKHLPRKNPPTEYLETSEHVWGPGDHPLVGVFEGLKAPHGSPPSGDWLGLAGPARGIVPARSDRPSACDK